MKSLKMSGKSMKQIGLKFCGGCNPLINRSEVINHLKQILPDEIQLATTPSREIWIKLLLICGCHNACVERYEIMTLAIHWVVVSGPMVEHINIPGKISPD